MTDEGLALRAYSPEIADLYEKLKDQEYWTRDAEKRRAELNELPVDSEIVKLEAEHDQAIQAYEKAKVRVTEAQIARRKAYDDRTREKENDRKNWRKIVAAHADKIAAAEREYEDALDARKAAKKTVDEQKKRLSKNKEYERRKKLRNELKLVDIRTVKQKREAGELVQDANAKLVRTLDRAIAQSERDIEAAAAQVDKYQKRVDRESKSRKAKGPSENEAQLESAKLRFEAAQRANDYYVELWVRYWQEGESLQLTEGAQTIVVSHDGLTLEFVRDPRDEKPEGAMIGYGQLAYDSADNLRAFELRQQNLGNPSPTLDQYEAFRTETEPVLNLVLEAFVGSEGKPDTFITSSAGGVTLGPGFTGAALGHMIAALKRDNPAVFDEVFGQFGLDVADDKGDQLSLYIPEGDLVPSIAARQDAPLDVTSAPYDETGSTKKILKDARQDPKLLYVITAAAHNPTFRAEFVKYFLVQIEEARSAMFKASSDEWSWQDLGKTAMGGLIIPEMELVWLLPLIHGSIAGGGQKPICAKAQAYLDSENGRVTPEVAAHMWWEAADKLRHTTGKRWRNLNKTYGGETWFQRLVADKE
ncbi:MAG: hypothetical protein HC927_03720 [Deltaproteobacteria bacterium]|nr:hypothetical protein [Deltaproteobacteria bacterium]